MSAFLEALNEEEAYLLAIITDPSGLDLAEFVWEDPETESGRWRAWDFQHKWYRCLDPLQIDQSARSVGKSLSIRMRAFAFPFVHSSAEMVVTAPELVHLQPIIGLIERAFNEYRIGREMLPKARGQGITHRPFQCDFLNGSRILGRIPQRDGKGIKGSHPLWLEMDEACFSGHTLVFTRRGYIPIRDVNEGDEVLTHKNRWRRVLALHDRGVRPVVKVRGQGHFGIEVTEGHHFWSRQILDWNDRKNKSSIKKTSETGWYPIESLINSGLWSSPSVVPSEPIPLPIPKCRTGNSYRITGSEDFYWLLGLYIAEGSTSSGYGAGKPITRATWSVHAQEVKEVSRRFDGEGIHNYIVSDVQSSKDCKNLVVNHAELARWLERNCGRGCHNKGIPIWVYGSDEWIRRAVFDGLVYGDGNPDLDSRYSPGRWKLTTTSRALAFGSRILAQSLGYHVSVHFIPGDRKIKIRGREATSGPSYQVVGGRVGYCLFEEGVVYSRCKAMEDIGTERVYDLTIEDDNSFVAESLIVHNSDYPEAGWTEIFETLKRGHTDSRWRAHGVTRGVRDTFYKITQPESGWTVHRYPAFWRPTWSNQERQEKIIMYGSRDNPDYKRNILGEHGDMHNALFVLARLMACVDREQSSPYNLEEYKNIRISGEMIEEVGGNVDYFISQLPNTHRDYKVTWSGQDVGYTNHPSVICTFAEIQTPEKSGPTLKLLSKIQLDRVHHVHQAQIVRSLVRFYHPRSYTFDKTGVGLPLYQELQYEPEFSHVIKGFNFSEKILADIDQTVEVDEFSGDVVKEAGIQRNALEYSSDRLRMMVDQNRLILPWDRDLLGEFQGQTYVVVKDAMNMYGKKEYNKGNFHALDACRMAVLGYVQAPMEAYVEDLQKHEPVFDVFVQF